MPGLAQEVAVDLVGVDEEEEGLRRVVLAGPLEGGLQGPAGAVGVGVAERVLEGGVLEGLEAPLQQGPGHLGEGAGPVSGGGERLGEGGDLCRSPDAGAPCPCTQGGVEVSERRDRGEVPRGRGHRALEAEAPPQRGDRSTGEGLGSSP